MIFQVRTDRQTYRHIDIHTCIIHTDTLITMGGKATKILKLTVTN